MGLTVSRRRKSTPGPYLFHVKLLRDRIKEPDQFPYSLPFVRHLDRLEFHPRVTFFVGENGSGKSTLMEAMAIGLGLNPEGGSRNFNFSTRSSHSRLDECLRIARSHKIPDDSFFLRAESYYNVASEVDRLEAGGPGLLASYGDKSLHEQSHGESFLALFENRFWGHGIYLLDEPEAALSPKRQLAFLKRMHDLCEEGSQFLIATHSPILMAYPHAWIYSFDDGRLRRVPYRETDHYLVTRRFLTHTDSEMTALLSPDPDPLSPTTED
jgi:predicted ATPase